MNEEETGPGHGRTKKREDNQWTLLLREQLCDETINTKFGVDKKCQSGMGHHEAHCHQRKKKSVTFGKMSPGIFPHTRVTSGREEG
jgi:hypothetical protein